MYRGLWKITSQKTLIIVYPQKMLMTHAVSRALLLQLENPRFRAERHDFYPDVFPSPSQSISICTT